MKGTTLMLVLLVAILACVVCSARGRGRNRARGSAFRGRFRNWRKRVQARNSTTGNTGKGSTRNESDMSSGNDTDVWSGNATDVSSDNETDVWSGNAIDVWSGNETDVFSGNATDMSSGNETDVSSDNATGVSSAGSESGQTVPGRPFSGFRGLRRGNRIGLESRGRRPGGTGGWFRGRNNRNKFQMPPGITFNSWRREVSDTANITERAVINSTGETIIFMSFDQQLLEENIQGSVSAYDFDNNMAAVRVTLDGERVCALVPVSIVTDFNSTVDDIKARTMKTPVSPTTLVGDFLFVEGSPLAIDLQSSSSFLWRFCNMRRPWRPVTPPTIIIDAMTEVDSMIDLTGTPSVTVMTINGKVTIHKTTTATLTAV